MRSLFNKGAINKYLPGIILLSHGGLAMGMLDTVKLIMGNTENMAAFTLDEMDDAEKFRAAFLDAVEAFPAGVVIFVDMFGGSPCNQLLMSAHKITNKFCAISGMNLPLVTEAIAMRTIHTGDELYDAILKIIPGSIVNLNTIIAGLAEDD